MNIVISKEILEDLYTAKRHSAEKIGKQLGKSKHAVLKLLKDHGIERRKNTDKLALTGQEIGHVTVLNQEDYDSKRRSRWRCKCICGKEVILTSTNIFRNKENISCGCRKVKKYNKNWKGTDFISTSVYRKIYRNAIERDIEYDLREGFIEQLLIAQDFKCIYTNLPIECLSNTPTGSLDRIDNSKGYTEDNVLWVHKKINSMKNAFSLDEFYTLCKLFVDNNEYTFDLDLVDVHHARPAKTREKVRAFLFDNKLDKVYSHKESSNE